MLSGKGLPDRFSGCSFPFNSPAERLGEHHDEYVLSVANEFAIASDVFSRRTQTGRAKDHCPSAIVGERLTFMTEFPSWTLLVSEP